MARGTAPVVRPLRLDPATGWERSGVGGPGPAHQARRRTAEGPCVRARPLALGPALPLSALRVIEGTPEGKEPRPPKLVAMSTPRQRLGALGERLAEQHLVRQGYALECRNYHCRYGEVDLILRQGPCWVFVEVKTRRSLRMGSPGESVTLRKQGQVLRTALYFLAERRRVEDPCRFDVVEVLLAAGTRPQVRHIPNAFCAEGLAL